MNVNARKTAAAWLSVASNVTLVTLKIAVGLFIGSVSVISEAIHSGVDLLAAVIALLAVRESAKPADEKHPFGHGKFENISGTIEAVLIFGAAAWIIYEAYIKGAAILQTIVKGGHPPDVPFSWGVLVMLVSAIVNWLVSRILFKVGKETDSVALQADGWHLRTDVWTSVGVMAGLGAIIVGDWIVPTRFGAWLHLIDPLAAVAVAMLILKAAWELTAKSARDLLDTSMPDADAWIKELLKTRVPQIHGFHKLRTRKAGSTVFVDFHIVVNRKMTVEDSHKLAHEISGQIKAHFPGSNVTVHVEPCTGDCDHCLAGCLLKPELREAIRKAWLEREALK